MKRSLSILLITALSALAQGNHSISLKYGLTSLENDSSTKFENSTLSLDGVYDTRYVIDPRVDLVYVNVDDSKRWGGVSSTLQLALSGQYETSTDYKLSPYVFGGLGYESVSDGVKCFDSNPFLQLGAGLKYALTPKINLLGEVKGLQVLGGDNQDNELLASVGVNFLLGAMNLSKPAPMKVSTPAQVTQVINTKQVSEIDSDHDGVPDTHDDCPGTDIKNLKANESIAQNGCVQIILLDTDNDGLTDDVDKCPNTPFEERKNVDANGCSKAVATPIQTETNYADMGDKIDLHIKFDSSKSDIKAEAMHKIKAFAKYIKSLGADTIVTINGYTDSSGNEANNKKLSRDRAFAVRQALIKAGLKPSQVRAYGLGSLNPIATNKTAEGRAKNRRIEAVIEH